LDEDNNKFIPINKSTICHSIDHRIHNPDEFNIIEFINFFNNTDWNIKIDKILKKNNILNINDLDNYINNKHKIDKYNKYSDYLYNIIDKTMSVGNLKRFLTIYSTHSHVNKLP